MSPTGALERRPQVLQPADLIRPEKITPLSPSGGSGLGLYGKPAALITTIALESFLAGCGPTVVNYLQDNGFDSSTAHYYLIPNDGTDSNKPADNAKEIGYTYAEKNNQPYIIFEDGNRVVGYPIHLVYLGTPENIEGIRIIAPLNPNQQDNSWIQSPEQRQEIISVNLGSPVSRTQLDEWQDNQEGPVKLSSVSIWNPVSNQGITLASNGSETSQQVQLAMMALISPVIPRQDINQPPNTTVPDTQAPPPTAIDLPDPPTTPPEIQPPPATIVPGSPYPTDSSKFDTDISNDLTTPQVLALLNEKSDVEQTVTLDMALIIERLRLEYNTKYGSSLTPAEFDSIFQKDYEFKAKISVGQSWTIVARNRATGNFWISGQPAPGGGFSADLSLDPIKTHGSANEFEMGEVVTPLGTTAQLVAVEDGPIVIGFFDENSKMVSWFNAATGEILFASDPTETATPVPAEAKNPYESITKVNPSELTIDLFLDAMPVDIRTTHENPSVATQEQKDIHDQWITDAWKAVFSNLTDVQLTNMGLNRADIPSLGHGQTGEMYTEVDGKDYPVYDYSLLRTIVAFSQEFGVYQAPFIISLGEQIKVDSKNWIDAHRDTVNPGETEGRWYGYGSNGGYFTHEEMMKGTMDIRKYFGKDISMKRATLEWAFSGDLRLVFDYPGYPNSHIGLISMNDTDPQKTQRFALILFNIGQGGPDMTMINPALISDDGTDKFFAINFAGAGGSTGGFEIRSIDELLQVIRNSYDKLGLPPHISKMAGGEGDTFIANNSGIPYTRNFWFYPSVEKPTIQTPSTSTPTPPKTSPTSVPQE